MHYPDLHPLKALLRIFHQPCLAIVTTPSESHLWSEIAMVTGEVHECLGKINLAKARSVVAITDSERNINRLSPCLPMICAYRWAIVWWC